MCSLGKGLKNQLSTTISFTEDEARHVQHPHDDVLVTMVLIAHLKMHRVLAENESSVNIIFKKALDQLRMDSLKVKPVDVLFVSFTGAAILSIGMIDPICLGETPNKATQMTTFMIIDQPSMYTIIIGRPTFIAFRAFPPPTT